MNTKLNQFSTNVALEPSDIAAVRTNRLYRVMIAGDSDGEK